MAPHHSTTDDRDETGDTRLRTVLQQGLPLVPRPYAALGCAIGMSEAAVMTRLRAMLDNSTIKRFGVVVRHHELGYCANAMVVWDVPDDQAAAFGQGLVQHDFVTLCYRRARCLPEWPYNLYCMIHGRARTTVLEQIESLTAACGLQEFPRAVLFSCRRFKQGGACYQSNGAEERAWTR
jgi:DNA-binding Lrp family transcriptional regulator